MKNLTSAKNTNSMFCNIKKHAHNSTMRWFIIYIQQLICTPLWWSKIS